MACVRTALTLLQACLPCPNRSLLLPAQRVLLLLCPSIRQLGVGTSLLLERQPEEGLRGALRQLLHVLSGAAQPADR